MNAFGDNGVFHSISQRVASTYLRMLANFYSVGSSSDKTAAAAQADLFNFFNVMYEALYASPGEFGLPETEDIFLLKDHDKEGPNKTDVKRILDRPRKMVEDGLEFLRRAGIAGRMEGASLVIHVDSALMDFINKKSGRAWINGLASTGLGISQAGGSIWIDNAMFPWMMPALQTLAQACAGCKDEALGRIFFARCDFRALQQDFSVAPLDLYRIFTPEDYAWAVELHNFFTGRGYQPQIELGRMFNWSVKYQGKKAIKSTPLFQIDYDERLLHQMRAAIKVSSAGRILPLVTQHSTALQADFAGRMIPCGSCGWCDNKKTLGPVDYEYLGQQHKICWYVNSDIPELTPQAIEVVKEYAELHEALEPL